MDRRRARVRQGAGATARSDDRPARSPAAMPRSPWRRATVSLGLLACVLLPFLLVLISGHL